MFAKRNVNERKLWAFGQKNAFHLLVHYSKNIASFVKVKRRWFILHKISFLTNVISRKLIEPILSYTRLKNTSFAHVYIRTLFPFANIMMYYFTPPGVGALLLLALLVRCPNANSNFTSNNNGCWISWRWIRNLGNIYGRITMNGTHFSTQLCICPLVPFINV